MRILFIAEPEVESEVRHRIEAALASGQLEGPDGVITQWQLCSSEPSDVSRDEASTASV